MHHRQVIWLLPATAMLAAFWAWLGLPAPRLAILLQEGHVLETFTVWAWALAVLTLLTVAAMQPRDRWTPLAMAVLSVLLAARELDLHKSLTGTSVLRVSWYLKGPFSATKVVALGMLAMLAATVLYLLWRHARSLWHRIRQGELPANATLAFVVTLVSSKVLDRMASMLIEDLGVPLSLSASVLIQGGEEMLELTLPLIIACTCLQCLQHLRQPGQQQSSDEVWPGQHAGSRALVDVEYPPSLM